MRRFVACVCVVFALALSSCGGHNDATATPSPRPLTSTTTGILAPARKAQSTVDQLNQLQNRMEQQSGGGSYNP